MERPLERRSAARTAVIWDGVAAAVDSLAATRAPGAGPIRIIDIGGGTGRFAVRLAADGHLVTVVDPSPDALAALARRADEDGVSDRITGIQGDIGSLVDQVGVESADLVLCHGLLGILPDRNQGLAAIARVLGPDGIVSVLVGQRSAAVLARAVAGHFRQAQALLADEPGSETGEHRFTPDELAAMLAEHGFGNQTVHGIRVFADLVPSALLDLEPGATAALLDLERAVANRPEYLALAAQLHVIARRS